MSCLEISSLFSSIWGFSIHIFVLHFKFNFTGLENTVSMISVVLNLLRHTVAKHMVHLDEWFIVHIKCSIFCSGQSHYSGLPNTFWLSLYLLLIIEKALLKSPAVLVNLWIFHFISMRYASCIPNLSDSMRPTENGYVFLMNWPFYLLSLVIVLVLTSKCLGLTQSFKHVSDESRAPGL